jgi:anti-sigma regulatory factor (Ser/Thr protein kinase)
MPALLPSTTELVIRNDIAQLAVLSEAMERIGVGHGIAPKPLIQLQVALDEMVSNVIKYAWPEGGSHEIRVRIAVGNGQVEVEISDDGRAFDPLHAPAPQPPPPGWRPQPGGVGVHMVKQLMERIEYVRTDGRNCLTMTKQCNVGVQTGKEDGTP